MRGDADGRDSDLEGRAGVAGPRREVEGDDEVDAALRPQDEGVGQVVRQPAVHNVDLFTLDVQGLVDAHKLIGVWGPHFRQMYTGLRLLS